MSLQKACLKDRLHIMMNTVPIDGDGAYRAGRAEILARSAADALLLVDRRDPWALLVIRILPDHPDRSDRAVVGTVSAADPVTVHDTEVIVHAGSADLPFGFLLRSDLKDGSSRADLGAFHAFRTAVAFLKRHLWLYQVLKSGGWSENIVRADGHAELAGRAVLVKLLHALGTEWSNRRFSVRGFLWKHLGESSISLLVLDLLFFGPHRNGRQE